MFIRNSKKITTITLLAIFIICFIFIVLRWINCFNDNIYVITELINSHITNFTISLMLCTLVGYLMLSMESKYRYVIIFGILIVVCNLIYEILLPILNTIDIIDALYGIIAVVLSLIYLFFIDKYGFNS